METTTYVRMEEMFSAFRETATTVAIGLVNGFAVRGQIECVSQTDVVLENGMHYPFRSIISYGPSKG